MVTRLPARALAAVFVVLSLLAVGACSDDDDPTVSGSATGTGDGVTSTTAADATTTTAGGGTTTTAVASGPTSTAVPAGGEGEGVIELTIAGGKAEGGVRRETVQQGAQVTLRVTSDIAEELHVHTYDLRIDLEPGRSSDLTFLARIPGVFEVELEGSGTKVLELEVRP